MDGTLVRKAHCVSQDVGHCVLEEVCVCDHCVRHACVYVKGERNAGLHADRMRCAEVCYQCVRAERLGYRRDEQVLQLVEVDHVVDHRKQVPIKQRGKKKSDIWR